MMFPKNKYTSRRSYFFKEERFIIHRNQPPPISLSVRPPPPTHQFYIPFKHYPGCYQRVGNAVTAQGARAVRGIVAGGAEKRADKVGGNGQGHLLKVATLGQTHSLRGTLGGVAAVGRPDRVDGVEPGDSRQSGGTAQGVVDVVVDEGDLVILAHQLQPPVRTCVHRTKRTNPSRRPCRRWKW